MKKYLFIYKLSIMSNLQYIFNILVNSLGYIIHIFIFVNLWNYIYSDESQLINGYSKSQMIWYVILTEILWSAMGGRKLCRNICDDVKSGNITYNINKPYSYVGYVFSNHLGTLTIKFIIYTLIGIILGLIFNGAMLNLSIQSIICTIFSALLALLINAILIIGIGLISLIIEEANPLFWLYSKMILIFGTIFPVEFFPGILQKIVTISPIYAISYGPAKIFVGCTKTETVNIFIMQCIYLIIAIGISALIFKKGVRRLNVNGG